MRISDWSSDVCSSDLRRGSGGRHFAFAGHTDVVPVGHGWTQEPFAGKIAGGMLHGRGAVDMKGAIAAFVAAAGRVRDHDGSLSLIITGDAEGAATFGTGKLLAGMEAKGQGPETRKQRVEGKSGSGSGSVGGRR